MVTTRNRTNAQESSAKAAPKTHKKPEAPAPSGPRLKRPSAKLAASQANKKVKVSHKKTRASAKSSPPEVVADSDDDDADEAQSWLEGRDLQQDGRNDRRRLHQSTSPLTAKTKNDKTTPKSSTRILVKKELELDDENEDEDVVEGEDNNDEHDKDESHNKDNGDDDDANEADDNDHEPQAKLPTKRKVIKVKSKSAKTALAERRKQVEQARRPRRGVATTRSVPETISTADASIDTSVDTTSGNESDDNESGGGEQDYDDVSSSQDSIDLDVDMISISSTWDISKLELFDDSANNAVQECIDEIKEFWTESDERKMPKSTTRFVRVLEIHKPWSLAADAIKNVSHDAGIPANELRQLITDLVDKLRYLNRRKQWRHSGLVLRDFYTVVYPALALLLFMTISVLGPDRELDEEDVDKTIDAVSCIVSLNVATAQLEHRLIGHLFPDPEKQDKAARKDFVKQMKTSVGPRLAQIERSFKAELKRLKDKKPLRRSRGRDEPLGTGSPVSPRAGRISNGDAEHNRQERDWTDQAARERAIREQYRARRTEFQRLEARCVAKLDAANQAAQIQKLPRRQQSRIQDHTSEADFESSWNEDWERLDAKLSSGRLNTREARIIQDDKQNMVEQRIEHYKRQIWRRLCEINDEKSINMGAQARIQYCVDDDEIREYCSMSEEQVVGQLKQLVKWALEEQEREEQESEGARYDLGWMEHFVREWGW